MDVPTLSLCSVCNAATRVFTGWNKQCWGISCMNAARDMLPSARCCQLPAPVTARAPGLVLPLHHSQGLPLHPQTWRGLQTGSQAGLSVKLFFPKLRALCVGGITSDCFEHCPPFQVRKLWSKYVCRC